MSDGTPLASADLVYYNAEVAPILPPKVLDFHTHIWSADDWKRTPWEGDKCGGKYMVTTEQYPASDLLRDGRRCFPDRAYHAVCFGYPVPVMNWENDTAFVMRQTKEHPELWPLVVAGRDLELSRERYERAFAEGRFYGFKVFLNWYGNDYADIGVEDMLGPLELAVANERRLVIMLHVPRSGRLADPEVQEGVRWLSRECPDARIVLAHCGRCYLPAEMKAAIDSIVDLPNVWMDTSMVMDPVTLYLALNAIGPRRLLFATDFPVAAMRGRRVRVLDHWVDVVSPGYPESAFRVAGEAIHAGFMAWEIVTAIRWAAEMAGLREDEIHGIFWNNGMELLASVMQREE